MSSRIIGGGRVLGSGRNLEAPTPLRRPNLLTPPLPAQDSSHDGSTSIKSLSLGSSPSLEPLHPDIDLDGQDVGSKVSLEQAGPSGSLGNNVNEASLELMCPICNEAMVTLLQLNQHLDDSHQNLEEVTQNEAKDWFKAQVIKAQKFKPFAMLNQKMRAFEPFEMNSTSSQPGNTPDRQSQNASTATAAATSLNPDDVVQKSHWQKPRLDDRCSDPICSKRLSNANGYVNCRHCGKLFCNEHTMYQMKLSRSAQHEPVRGMWCRVCETCFKSRPGYNDKTVQLRDWTSEFVQERTKALQRTRLDIARLQNRLTKLTQLLSNIPDQSVSSNSSAANSFFMSLTGASPSKKQLEQSVVDWEDDAVVGECPFCRQEFSSYIFRRHHCRLCGRVVCADPETECSREVELDVIPPEAPKSDSKLVQSEAIVSVRMCKYCRELLFSRADFAAAISHKPPDIKAYENLLQFESGIRSMLPKFHQLLTILQNPQTPPTAQQLSDAKKTRKRLVDAFTQYSIAARRLRDLPTTSETQKKVQKAMYQRSYQFLQLHMLPLQFIPKQLSQGPPPLESKTLPATQQSDTKPPVDTMTSTDASGGSTIHPAKNHVEISNLEAEEKDLRETLIVLEEQLFLLQQALGNANKARKLDEAATLAHSVNDLDVEIERVKSRLTDLDFATAYGVSGDV